MNLSNNIFLNFFSIGSLIPALFHFLIALYFFQIPGKSRATFHIALGYLCMTVFNVAYVFSSSVYNPVAAYHRWITVGIIMLGETHFNMFLYYYGRERIPRFSGLFLGVQYSISLLVSILFFWGTLKGTKVYHFDGHYWDFAADKISTVIGLIIMAYILLFIVIMIFKMIFLKGRDRGVVLLMGCAYLAATIIPSITNTMSREGLIQRDVFQTTWVIFNLFGFFLLAIIYINNTNDKSTFMAKIMGISMVTLLVLLQGLSYYFLSDKESSYDELHRLQLSRISSQENYRPSDLIYTIRYSLKTGALAGIPGGDDAGDDSLKREFTASFQAAYLRWRIDKISESTFEKGLRQLTQSLPPYLDGYRRSLIYHLDHPGNNGLDPAGLKNYLASLELYTLYYSRKIKGLPDTGFRENVLLFLKNVKPIFLPFRDHLLSLIVASRREGSALKEELLFGMRPLRGPGTRFYRMSGEVNKVCFIHFDPESQVFCEGGFSYLKYREFIHPASLRLVLIMGILIVFMLLGFRIFFLGAFIRPLRRLINGVSRVNEGDLSVEVPVTVEDEIGYLSRSFNNMVSSLKNADEERTRIRVYLQSIIDSMPSQLIGVDDAGRITHWNTAAEKKLQIPSDEAIGKYISDIFPHMDFLVKKIRQAMWDKTPPSTDRIQTYRNGDLQVLELMVYPLQGPASAGGAVIRIDDVTAKIRFEEMMIQTEKMMSVGGLAAGMAHEINNPLGGILLGAQNILRRFSPDNPINNEAARECGVDLANLRKYLETREIFKMMEGILEMGERASRIVSNMLSFSRRSESRKSPRDVTDIINRTIDLAAQDYDLTKRYDFRHIDILREYEPGLPIVCCVETEIEQVFLNLLKNAAHAMMENGHRVAHPVITIRARREGDSIRIEVEDNGIGMDEKIRKSVFDPFFTTKKVGAGTGLGLSVSYFIITNNHRGTLSVESSPGKGTKFIIILPLGNVPGPEKDGTPSGESL